MLITGDVPPEEATGAVAPRLVKAVGAELAPVPPLATATIPETFPAVPLTLMLQVPDAPKPVRLGAPMVL